MKRYIVEYKQRSPYSKKTMFNMKRVSATSPENAVVVFENLRLQHEGISSVWEQVMAKGPGELRRVDGV